MLRGFCVFLFLFSACASAPSKRQGGELAGLKNPPQSSESQAPAQATLIQRELTHDETVGYAYATGCFQAYQRICGAAADALIRSACQEDGLASCEAYARKFSNWIQSGKPRRD